MLIVSTGTAYAQSLIPPDCKGIFYTDDQDKRCLECLLNFSERDSLTLRLLINDMECDSIVGYSNEQKSIMAGQLKGKKKQLNRANLKLSVLRPLVRYGIPVSVLAGILIGMSLK